MRTDDEYRQILGLWEQGYNQVRIAHMIQIPRATVRECIVRYETVAGLEAVRSLQPRAPETLRLLRGEEPSGSSNLEEAYSYLFGVYLGDGYINKEPRTYKLRIFLATAYPDIINTCIAAIETLLPMNKVGLFQGQGNYVEVNCFNNFLPEFFPQYGPGMKHTRPIILEPWQKAIINRHPLRFFKGLFHSDGCRASNMVKGKDYPRYEFKNNSEDILGLFADTCHCFGLHWTQASNGMTVQIARRADVAFLDQHIGPKS